MAEIEEDEIDTTAEKAADIGKEVGVADKEKEDDLPDYDVVEEKEEGDERIAKEREEKPVRGERKQLTNKEKRDLRKKRVTEKFNEKDDIIRQQQQELQALNHWKNEVEGRLTNVDRGKVDEALNQNIAAFTQAEKDHAAAFTEGDGVKATSAMRVMYDAQRNIEKLQGMKQQYEKQPVRPVEKPNAPDPVLVNNAKKWASRHSWYKSDGGDEDSAIAQAISGTLANEGYDPKTDDFWDELDDRLAARGIGDDIDGDEPPVVSKRRTSAPPIGGGSKRGDSAGKVKVTLPTAYINACKEAGKWDDKPTRDRMISRYLQGVKNQERGN